MRIAVGCDHAGFPAKAAAIEAVRRAGHEAVDLGTRSPDSVDYPLFGRAVAEAVAAGRAERGIALCGSGIGISIAANRVPGVRAAVCHTLEAARLSRLHNDANVLCLGARLTPPGEIGPIVEAWLATPFEGGERHVRRVGQLGAFLLALAAAGLCARAFAEETPAAACEAYRAALDPRDAEGHLALARWCAERGLEEPRRSLLAHVLALDPSRAEAYRGLGYVLRDGVWMSPADARREEPSPVDRSARLGEIAKRLAAADEAGRAAAEADLLGFVVPADAKYLRGALDARQAPVRRAAALALWRIGEPKMVVDRFLDPRWDYPDELKAALAQPPREALVEAARERLLRFLKGKERVPEDRLLVVIDLLDTAPGGAAAELLYRLAIESPGAVPRAEAGRALARRKAVSAAEAALELLARGTALGRERAGQLLVHLGEARAVPLLVDSLEKSLRARSRAAARDREPTGFLISDGAGTTLLGRCPFGYNAFLGAAEAAEARPNFKDVPFEVTALQALTGESLSADVAAWRGWLARSAGGAQ